MAKTNRDEPRISSFASDKKKRDWDIKRRNSRLPIVMSGGRMGGVKP